MSAQNLGVRPGLQYVSKSKLQVDHTYQREMSTKRSQHLVERIAAEWSWLHCGAIVVAPAGGGKFNILDGQHRHAAAMKIPEISDLPCVISTARSLIEQARAFIALNRDRIALTGLSIFWSEVAAGDAEGKALVSACRKAGVTILRNTVGGIQMKPDQTVALGVIRRLYRGELDDLPGGASRIVEVLTLLLEAFPNKPGQLTAAMIEATARALGNGVQRKWLLAALRETDITRLTTAAYKLRQNDEELSRKDAVYKAMHLHILKVRGARA
jgi:hypothetical protein